MYPLLRQILFQLPPEFSHDFSLASLNLLSKIHVSGLLGSPAIDCPVTAMGLHFKNPVGLAAGLDKNGDHIDAMASLGFGFIEIGTVTPKPQPGNPKPRMFRLPAARGIINRMGFNNKGVDHLVQRVQQSTWAQRDDTVLGINIGKNAVTPVENAAEDYLIGIRKTYALASYITVNLSSPNTPGLRDLQFGEPLLRLLSVLKEEQGKQTQEHGRYVPLLVKIAPDMAEDDIASVAKALVESGIDGAIATNTTIGRDAVKHLPHGQEAGGLSGEPVRNLSNQVLAQLVSELNGRIPVIGVGGISAATHALDKRDAGAALVQLYSGFIYEGPDLIRRCAEAWRDQ